MVIGTCGDMPSLKLAVHPDGPHDLVREASLRRGGCEFLESNLSKIGQDQKMPSWNMKNSGFSLTQDLWAHPWVSRYSLILVFLISPKVFSRVPGQ